MSKFIIHFCFHDFEMYMEKITFVSIVKDTNHLRIDTGAWDVIGVIEYISCSP